MLPLMSLWVVLTAERAVLTAEWVGLATDREELTT